MSYLDINDYIIAVFRFQAAFEKQFPSPCKLETGGVWKGIMVIAVLIAVVFASYSSVMFVNRH